jgi:hypothetical protein
MHCDNETRAKSDRSVFESLPMPDGGQICNAKRIAGMEMATSVFTLHCSLYIVSLGTCGLDWFPAHPPVQPKNTLHDEKLSLVFLVHGLNNSARSYYIQHAMRVFAKDGKSKARFFCCSFNMRQILH